MCIFALLNRSWTTEPLKVHDGGKKMRWEEKKYFNAFPLETLFCFAHEELKGFYERTLRFLGNAKLLQTCAIYFISHIFFPSPSSCPIRGVILITLFQVDASLRVPYEQRNFYIIYIYIYYCSIHWISFILSLYYLFYFKFLVTNNTDQKKTHLKTGE